MVEFAPTLVIIIVKFRTGKEMRVSFRKILLEPHACVHQSVYVLSFCFSVAPVKKALRIR